MRAILQRASRCRVTNDRNEELLSIERGLFVLVGVAEEDTEEDAKWLAHKVCALRIYHDADGKMQHSIADVGGSVLAVSQFTLVGDCRNGSRPSFRAAAGPDVAEGLFRKFATFVADEGLQISAGFYPDRVDVELVNDGPITLMLDSKKLF
jgi:D-tyrosyl-tRNA(Tyr) deacylase